MYDGGEYETRYVSQLVSELAEARTEEVERREVLGKEVTLDDEKRFSASWLKKALADLQRRRLQDGAGKLGDQALAAITQGVMDTSFHGAKLWRTWEEAPTALNFWAQGTDPGRMEMPDGLIVETPPVASTIEELRTAIRALRAKSSRPDAPWDHLNHELELVIKDDGTRLTAIDFVVPVPFVTLRRPTLKTITLDDLVKNGTMSEQCGRFLKAAVKAKFRIMVGGSMNSGKTVTLRALAAALPTDAALVTAESQGELLLQDGAGEPYPKFITALEARKAGADGHGAVSLNELIYNAQRMSPTCVIVGEVRGEEAQALSKAVQQGYQVMSTIHGYSAVHSVSNAALYLEQHTGITASAALKRMADGIDLAIFMEQIEGKRIVAEVAAIGDAMDGIVKSDMIFDHVGVMNPLPESVKRRLERFGLGDGF